MGTRLLLGLALIVLVGTLASRPAFTEDKPAAQAPPAQTAPPPAPAPAPAPTPTATPTATAPAGATKLNSDNQRNFYEVLEDVLGDFEFDIKSGEVVGLKDLSIRNIALSENVPPSFRSHLELAMTERILKNAHTRVIQCLPCRAKRTTVDGDNVVITSADTNPVELARIAKLSGIRNFMDVAFSYQSSGMFLSMYIMDPETGAITWSRSYNSETSRAAAYRRGVDFSQIDKARRNENYVPTIQFRIGTYYMFEPNYSGYTGCLGVGLRMMERYDNRKKEVGFELNYLKDSSTFLAPTSTSLFGGFNLTLLFVHAFNFIGEEENYHRVRGGFFAAVGGTYVSGYLGGLVRAGWEWRLAKHWAVNANVGYRPTATAFLPGEEKKVSGAEFGIGIAALF